ncbi:MAG: response regulator transcription factor [Nitrospinae bacterium]|nr:response regulator transcription factor [Nitrospinota bacterium]
MRIVIVEDEPAAARQLEKMLRRVDGLNIQSLDRAASIGQARERLSKGLDILFLDLNIMGESGLALLKEFLSEPFETIITTAYPEHALEAFELGARDYLVKPFSQERLALAVSRVPEPSPDKSPAIATILVKERGGITPVPVEGVLMIRSAGDYSELVMRAGGVKLCSRRMDFLEKRLPADFMRVHRSAIVRLSTVKSVHIEPGGRYSAVVEGCAQPVPVGRKYFKELKARLGLEE